MRSYKQPSMVVELPKLERENWGTQTPQTRVKFGSITEWIIKMITN